MGYVEKVLQPEETVVYQTTVHWFAYLQAMLWALLAVLAFIVSFQFLDAGRSIMQWIALAFLVLAGLLAVGAWIRRTTTELAITSRRVIYKAGLLRRTTFEINRSSVESVGVEQSVLGRILGYGRVDLKGTGTSVQNLPLIHDPLRFRSHITAS